MSFGFHGQRGMFEQPNSCRRTQYDPHVWLELCALTSTLDTACYECRSGTRLLASTCDTLEQQIGLGGLEGLARGGNTTVCTYSTGGLPEHVYTTCSVFVAKGRPGCFPGDPCFVEEELQVYISANVRSFRSSCIHGTYRVQGNRKP